MARYELCRHTHANGRRCGSPALKDQNWCFFHDRLHFRHRANREARPSLAPTDPRPLLIPVIEDRESVQVALSLIIEAIAIGTIDQSRANALLRGLSLASRNAHDLNTKPFEEQVIRYYTPTLDGLAHAPREMSDYSVPPDRPAKPPFTAPVSPLDAVS